MSKTLPFVSIIIPVYNDSERLKQCLQALEGQTYPQSQYEVVVVDNNSDDDIESLVGQLKQAVYEFEPAVGSYAARNKGISVSRGEMLGFTDSDCIPSADWIEKGVSHLTDEHQYVAGQISIFFKNPERPTIAELYDSLNCLNQQHYLESSHFGATANLFAHKELFEKVGLFNDKLKSGGDKDWGQRVFAAGHKQIYSEDVLVLHPARYAAKDIRKKTVRVTRGHCEMENKHQKLSLLLLRELYFDFKLPVRDTIKVFTDDNLSGLWHRLSYTWFYLYVQQIKARTKAKYYAETTINIPGFLAILSRDS